MKTARGVAALVPVFLAALVLSAAGPGPRDITRAVADPRGYVAGAGADGFAVLVVGAAGWLVVAWRVVGVGALTATRLPGAAGALARAVAERTLPAALRRGVAVALGISLAGGTGAATGARAGLSLHGSSAAAIVATAVATPNRATNAAPPAVDWPTGETDRPIPVPSISPTFRAAPAAHRPARPPAHDVRRVVVRPGDCLWTIARRHLPAGADDARVAATWPRWYAANRAVIGGDPDLIHPGQVLIAPEGAK